MRSIIRLVLESEDKDSDDADDGDREKRNKKRQSNLLLEPESSKRNRREASKAGRSISSNMLVEPDSGDASISADTDSNDDEELDDAKREASGAAAAGGGPAMPLGAGPHYPGPDSPAVKRIKKQIDVVGRAYGGAKTTKKKSH